MTTKNRVLRRIFGPEKDEATEMWRKLHKKEFRDLYCSPCIIRVFILRRIRWTGHVERRGEKRIAYALLVGKPDGKKPLGRPKRGWWIILSRILER
jgi:hypothetical protein